MVRKRSKSKTPASKQQQQLNQRHGSGAASKEVGVGERRDAACSSDGARFSGRRKKPRRNASTMQSGGCNVRLSDEDEMRLGKLAGTALWMERVRQGRGSNACLHLDRLVRSSAEVGATNATLARRGGKEEEWIDCVAHPADGQRPFRVRFGITSASSSSSSSMAASTGYQEVIEALLKDKNPVLLSGFGAQIEGGNDQMDAAGVIYGQGNITLKLLVQAYAASPYLDVCAGRVEKRPCQESTPDKGKYKDSTSMGPPPVPLPRSLREESSCSSSTASSTSTATPDWMRTPLPPLGGGHQGSRPIANYNQESPTRRGNIDRTATTSLMTMNAAGPRPLGGKLYTPISDLGENFVNKNVCVMGLVRTDRVARRALGGSRDWSLSVGLCDIDDHDGAHTISFNLFAGTEDDLPKCRPGQILCLRTATKVVRFQSAIQGTGFRGFQWALADIADGSSSNENGRVHVQTSPRAVLHAEEKDELIRLTKIYARDQAAGAAGVAGANLRSLATTSNNAMMTAKPGTRQLIRLEEVEPNVFFDAIVEVVKVWDAAGPRSPPTIYVTDYTAHPLYLYRNDVHLGVVSRDECVTIEQEIHGDDGRGRVLQVALWDEQMRVAGLVRVGQIVRMKNVRPKRQAENGFLCGGIGGSNGRGSDRSLCVVEVKDEAHLKEIRDRKKRYLEEIDQVKKIIAEKHQAQHQETEAKTATGKRTRSSSSSSASASDSTRFSSPEAFDSMDEEELIKASDQASHEWKVAVPTDREDQQQRGSSPAPAPSTMPPPPGQGRVLQSLPMNESPPERALPAKEAGMEEDPFKDVREAIQGTGERTRTEEARLAPTTLLDNVSAFPLRSLSDLRRVKVGPGEGKLFRCRVRVVDTLPSLHASSAPSEDSSDSKGSVIEERLMDWVQVKCGICQKRLEAQYGFCPSCADEDAKDVTYTYVFALLVTDASIAPTSTTETHNSQIALVVLASGKDAAQFLYGLHPRDVLRLPKSMRRLVRRLTPILGLDPPSSIPSTSGEAEEAKQGRAQVNRSPLPFEVGIMAYRIEGQSTIKFKLASTMLEKDRCHARADQPDL